MEDFVSSFVRIMPKQGYQDWMFKLGRMGMLFHEAEYQTVKQGHRPAAIIHIDQNSLGEMLEKINKDRAGVIFSSGIGGLDTFYNQIKDYVEGGQTPRFSPFFIATDSESARKNCRREDPIPR